MEKKKRKRTWRDMKISFINYHASAAEIVACVDALLANYAHFMYKYKQIHMHAFTYTYISMCISLCRSMCP